MDYKNAKYSNTICKHKMWIACFIPWLPKKKNWWLLNAREQVYKFEKGTNYLNIPWCEIYKTANSQMKFALTNISITGH